MSDDPIYIAEIKRNGGPVELKVKYGQLRKAVYDIDLWPPTDPKIKIADDSEENPGTHELADTGSKLADHALNVQSHLAAVPPDSDPGGEYNIDIDVFQDGQPVPVAPRPIRERGTLNDAGIRVKVTTIEFNVVD